MSVWFTVACVSPSAALLDVHPGYADQPREPVLGEDSQHAEDVCDDRPSGYRNRYTRAAGFPPEKGPGPATHLLWRCLSPAQELQLDCEHPCFPLCVTSPCLCSAPECHPALCILLGSFSALGVCCASFPKRMSFSTWRQLSSSLGHAPHNLWVWACSPHCFSSRT